MWNVNKKMWKGGILEFGIAHFNSKWKCRLAQMEMLYFNTGIDQFFVSTDVG